MSITYADVLEAMGAQLEPDALDPLGDVLEPIGSYVADLHAQNLPSDLPAELHLCACLHEHRTTSPAYGHTSGYGEWESDLWAFTRTAKAYPSWSGLSPAEALRTIESIVLGWPTNTIDDHGMGRGARIGERWVEWLAIESEDGRVELLTNWDKVRFLPGRDPVDNAIERAEREPLDFDPDNITLNTDGYKRFLSVAGWLQVVVGSDHIKLPVRLMGARLGVTRNTANGYCNAALADGYLELKREARHRHGGRSLAREYVFDVQRFDCLADAMKGTP